MTNSQPNSPATTASQPVEVLKHISALDGLRGVAISLVLCVHLLWANAHTSSRFINDVVKTAIAGWIGVDLFFVLSGFLITGILFDSLADRHFFRNFYGRRALRIMPLYYGSILLLYLVFHPPFREGFHPLLLLLLFLQNTPLWFHLPTVPPPASMMPHLWSLAAEEQFYLVWPLVIFLVRKRRTLLWIAALGALSAPCIRTLLYAHGVPGHDIYRLTICRTDTLLSGAWLALITRGSARQTVLRYAVFVFWPAVAVCLYIALSTGTFDGDTVPLIHYGYTCLALAGAALCAMSLRKDSRTEAIMSSSALRFMGKYSFGIYILHEFSLLLVQNVFFKFLRTHIHSLVLYHLVAASVALAATIGAAMVSYRFYEQPFMRLKRRFNYNRHQPATQ